VRQGNSILFSTVKLGSNDPRVGRRGKTVAFVERCELGTPTSLALIGQRTPLASVRGPANLLSVPGGVVAASRGRVVFLRWQ
jgi:hypothetical protein